MPFQSTSSVRKSWIFVPHSFHGIASKALLIARRIDFAKPDRAPPSDCSMPPAALSSSINACSATCLPFGLTTGCGTSFPNSASMKFPAFENINLTSFQNLSAISFHLICPSASLMRCAAVFSSKVMTNFSVKSSMPLMAPSMVAPASFQRSSLLKKPLMVSPSASPALPKLKFSTAPRRPDMSAPAFSEIMRPKLSQSTPCMNVLSAALMFAPRSYQWIALSRPFTVLTNVLNPWAKVSPMPCQLMPSTNPLKIPATALMPSVIFGPRLSQLMKSPAFSIAPLMASPMIWPISSYSPLANRSFRFSTNREIVESTGTVS